MAHEGSRPAGADDVADIVALITEATDELLPTRGGAVYFAREAAALRGGESFWIDVLDDADRHVVVGTYDGCTVGFGAVRVETLATGERLGVVEALFVLPDARGVSIGEAMMNDLITYCETKACIGIDAIALPGNRATKNFFETFGLVARAIVVHRALGSPRSD